MTPTSDVSGPSGEPVTHDGAPLPPVVGATGPGLPPQGVAEPDRDLARVHVELAVRVARQTPLPDITPGAELLTDIRDSLRSVLQLCCDAVGSTAGLLLIHDQANGELVPVARHGVSAALADGIGRVPTGSLGRLDGPLVSGACATDPRLAWAADLGPSPAVVALPMLSTARELLGLVVLSLPDGAAPDGEALSRAAAQARQSAEFVARARLHGQATRIAEQERARSAQLRQLAEVALSLTRAHDLDEVLRTVTEAARTTVHVHQAVTSRLPDGWAQATTYVSLSDKYAAWRSYDTPPRGLGVLNAVTRSNTPLRLTGPELVRHPEWRGMADAPGHPPLPDYLAAPLVGRDGSNLGLIQLADKQDGTPFTAEDEAIVVQLAQAASGAIETLELLEAVRARARTAEQVAAMAAALADTSTPDEVLDALVGHGGRMLSAAAVLVSLRHEGRLTLARSAGFPDGVPALLGATDLQGPLPVPRVVADRAPVFVESRDALTAAFPDATALLHADWAAWAFLPLIASGEVLGAWVVAFPSARRFSVDEQLGLATLAGVAAQALDRTRRRAAEHEMANALQQALLPRGLPAVEHAELAVHYEPAASDVQVGGDWFDALALPGGALGVVVGDVQGHSAEAAALMGQVHLALRAYAAEGHPPEQVLARTDALFRTLDTDRFATCCYLVLEPDGQVQLVRAGHPQPVLLPADGPPRILEVEGGLPLGIDGAPWPVTRLQLCPGDRLLLHTDGLVEPLREAGPDRLLALLAGARPGARGVVRAALRLLQEVPGRPDDVALLALQFHGEPLLVGPAPAEVSRARRAVRDRCLQAGVSPQVRETTELLATEVITNAQRHGTGTARVHVTTSQGAVRVAVGDDGPELPRPVEADADATGGRGLAILDALASAWGVVPAPHGKTVWFEVG